MMTRIDRLCSLTCTPVGRIGYTFIFLILLSAQALWGQQFRFNRFGTENGIPASSVHAIFQDNQGFIWFGTENGVCRFDGTNFKYFTKREGLADNEVYRIYGDRKGRIWFGSYNAPACYYQYGKIYALKNKVPVKGVPLGFAEDEKGDIYLAAFGFYKISGDSIFPVDLERQSYFTNVIYDKGTVKLISSYLSIIEFKPSGTRVIEKITEIPPESKRSVFFEDMIIVFGRNKVEIFKKSEESFKLIKTVQFPSQVINLNIDRDRNLWVSTNNNGAYRLKNFRDKLDTLHVLNGKFISSVFQDAEGGFWFSTVGEGVFQLNSLNIQSFTQASGFPFNQITSIAEFPKGNVTIGFVNGVIAFLKKDGSFKTSTIKEHWGNRVQKLIPEGDHLWCITDMGVYELNAGLEKQLYGWASAVKSFFKRGDQLMIGYNSSIQNLRISDHSLKEETTIRATALCVDKNGRTWAGTISGLFYKEQGSNNYQKFKSELNDIKVSDIKETTDGKICISTDGDGLLILRGDKLQRITQQNGLSSDICKSLYLDRYDNLWVCTFRGLNKIEFKPKGQFQVSVYSTLDGLISDEINGVCIVNDNVWVATSTGITTFRPDHLLSSRPPPVYISDFQKKEESKTFFHLSFPARVAVKVSYTGISFKGSRKISYKYRLLGLNSDWSYTSLSSIEYGSLSPGKYTFEVYAGLPQQIWSIHPARLTFEIKPFFWQTWYFNIACIVGFIFLISLLAYFYTKKVRTRQAEKFNLSLKMADLQMQAVRAQINPHFIFNCLNSIQFFLVQKDNISAQRYLSKFAKLIRTTLDFSKVTFVRLSDEIEYLENYLALEKLRFEDKFSYEVSRSPGINENLKLIPTMLIQPFIENTIVHAFPARFKKTGHLKVSFEKRGNHLCCIIDDNGVGRNAKKESVNTSYGTSLTEARVESINTLYKKKIVLEIIDKEENGESLGTTVIILIPLNHDQSNHH